jgi:E3 ubiquitin-protein ligase SHPRH
MDLVKKLSDEFNAFNACFNRRVAYFRALQSISDTVEPIALESDNVEDDLTKITERMSAARASFDKVNARRRYVRTPSVTA